MRKLAILLILLISIVFACISLTACNDDKKLNSRWHLLDMDLEDADDRQYVGFSLGSATASVYSVWMNVNNVTSKKLSIIGYKSDSSTFSISSSASKLIDISITKEDVKNAKKNNGGWIKLSGDSWSTSQSIRRLKMFFEGGAEINEIVFVDKDGKPISATIEKAYFYYEEKDSAIAKGLEYESSDLESIEAKAVTLPTNMLDEQDKFVLPEEKESAPASTSVSASESK